MSESITGSGRGEHGVSRRGLLRGTALGLGALSIPGLLAACDGGGSPKPSAPVTSGTGKRGGVLRLGVSGDTTETLNPLNQATGSDIARTSQLFERLAIINNDGAVEYVLADDMVPNDDASVWTLKLKQGVVWHDGKPFTADDVIYTMRYAVDSESLGANTWSDIDLKALKKVDETTVQVPLKVPNHLWPQKIVSIYSVIVKDGTTSFDKPIGTGPFKLDSWSAGQRSVFSRNDHYHIEGQPFLDGVEILTIGDPSARVNALSGGDVDVIAEVPLVSASTIESAPNLRLMDSPGGTAGALAIQVDNDGALGDVRVRQALRMLIDRQQVIDNAYGGRAKMANDFFCWYDPNYNDQLPQREYDPEQAKSLLKQAGYPDLSVTVQVGSNVYGGTVEMATLFAESAKAGGVNLKVNSSPAAQYYDKYYDKPNWPIFSTYWQGRTVAGQISETLLPGSYNETHFDNERFNQLFREATKSKDPAVQKDRLFACQEIHYNEGGFIIPVFANYINATSDKISGLSNGVTTILASYDFRTTSIA